MAFYEHHSLFLNVLQQQPIKMVKLTYFQLHLDPLQNIKEHQTPQSPPPPRWNRAKARTRHPWFVGGEEGLNFTSILSKIVRSLRVSASRVRERGNWSDRERDGCFLFDDKNSTTKGPKRTLFTVFLVLFPCIYEATKKQCEVTNIA